MLLIFVEFLGDRILEKLYNMVLLLLLIIGFYFKGMKVKKDE